MCVGRCVVWKSKSSRELLGLACTCNCGGPAERARHWKATLGPWERLKGSPLNPAQPDPDLGPGPSPNLHLKWFKPSPGACLLARPPAALQRSLHKSPVPCPPARPPTCLSAAAHDKCRTGRLGGAFASCVGEGAPTSPAVAAVR